MMAESTSWPGADEWTERPRTGRGRRYTPAERERAFQTWLTAGGRNQWDTAALLDIPRTTIQHWHDADGWPAQAMEWDRSAVESSRAVMRGMVAPLAVKAILALVRVLDNPKANDNATVKAAELALGYNGLVVPKHTINQRGPDLDRPSISAHLLAQLTPDELNTFIATRQLPPHLAEDQASIASVIDVPSSDPSPTGSPTT